MFYGDESLLRLIFYFSFGSCGELKGQGGIGGSWRSIYLETGLRLLSPLFICWIILGSMSAMIIGGSRIYYAMANDGLFFHHLLTYIQSMQVHIRHFLFQCIYASILIIFNQLEDLLILSLCAILFLSSLTAFILFVLKKEYKSESDYKIPLYPLPPLLYITANIILIGIFSLRATCKCNQRDRHNAISHSSLLRIQA